MLRNNGFFALFWHIFTHFGLENEWPNTAKCYIVKSFRLTLNAKNWLHLLRNAYFGRKNSTDFVNFDLKINVVRGNAENNFETQPIMEQEFLKN